MTNISANELKTKGVSALESILSHEEEAVITVRGKQKYVVVDMKKYDKMREYELEIALLEAKTNIEQGKVKIESVDEHMKRVTD